MASLKFTPALAKGSLIVITGVNGYIAAYVADEALAAGYRVRGTVRSVEKAKWLQELFDKKYGAGKFELVKVEDIVSEGTFDEAAKGASAFAHIATDVSVTPTPDPYIPNTTKSALSALKSAAKEPSIKRFVLTSSSMATAPWNPDVKYKIGPDSYNDQWREEAWKGPYDAGNIWKVYAASKVESERAAWQWVKETKPGFDFNVVLPAANFGKTINGGYQSTGGWVKNALDGDFSLIQYVAPQHFVDVIDDAKLHLGALIHPDVKGERVWGLAEPYNWNQVIDIVKEQHPDQKFPDGLPGLGTDLGEVPKERSEWLLKEFGLKGWTSLRDSLKRDYP